MYSLLAVRVPPRTRTAIILFVRLFFYALTQTRINGDIFFVKRAIYEPVITFF